MRSWPALLGLGTGTNFLDALGVGSFATTTAWLRGFHMVDDKVLPGTLNVGHSIPTVLQCILYLIALGGMVDKLTLVTMVLAGGVGAWYGAGIVAHWPRHTIRRGMAIALLVTAGFMALRMLMSLSLDDGSTGFTGLALAIAIIASLIIGSLTSLGIGNYAPTMAVTYLLGMNQRAVFPIMAASASLMLPVAALRFYRSGRFDRRVATGLALGGIPGVLLAVYIVKSLPLDAVRWIVVGVLLYTSATLYRSSLQSTGTSS
jgi:uncharacterized membrane protein YfcA